MEAVRQLWAYLLHNQMTTADALNIIFNLGRVAADVRFEEHPAALASVRFFHTSMEQAWRESRRGGSAADRAQSISHSFFEFDKAEVKNLLEDQAQAGPRSKRTRSADPSTKVVPKFCARFLLGSCTNKNCTFKHDCPFCPAPENRAKQCFLARLRNFGFDSDSRNENRGDGRRSYDAAPFWRSGRRACQ